MHVQAVPESPFLTSPLTRSRDDLSALGPPSPAVFESGLASRNSSSSLLSPHASSQVHPSCVTHLITVRPCTAC